MEDTKQPLARIPENAPDLSKITTQWNTSYDEIMRKWRKECAINMWLQQHAQYYFSKMDNLLAYPTILLSSITSIGIFASLSDDCSNAASQSYIMGSLAFSAAAFTAINKHMKSGERYSEHRACAQQFNILIRHIDYILCLNYEDRPNVKKTLEDIHVKMDAITNQVVDPPPHIVRKYELTHREIESAMFEDLKEERVVKRSMLGNLTFVRKLTDMKNLMSWTSKKQQMPQEDPPAPEDSPTPSSSESEATVTVSAEPRPTSYNLFNQSVHLSDDKC